MRPTLAIEGGEKLVKEPFPMWPSFSEKAIRMAEQVLRSGKVNYWTGSLGQEFEEKWAAYNGAKFAISTSNGTSALHTAVASLGIGPGDEVICPSYSFIASSFCVLQAGALPVFADTGTDHVLSPEAVEKAVTPRTKAILVVHLYGIVADMDPILEIARRHNLLVIEDCAQAFGGVYKGRMVGTLGNAGCFSFCQSKHFTTGGEGGAVITNDEDLAWICRSFRDHGYDVQKRLNLLELEAKLMYIHSRVGFNYRMTEMQSAIGLAELERFPTWNLPARRRNGRMIIEALKDHPLVLATPPDSPERENAFWWCPVVIDTAKIRGTNKDFVAAMNAEGVPAYTVLWPEMYKEDAYTLRRGFGTANYPFDDPRARRIDYASVSCPVAHGLTERTVSFFTHPVYTEAHMRSMIDAFKKVADAMMT
jgi:dTDP-4-amino-4,6-dideoxygalactose transaminase